jgi:PAC2 family.
VRRCISPSNMTWAGSSCWVRCSPNARIRAICLLTWAWTACSPTRRVNTTAPSAFRTSSMRWPSKRASTPHPSGCRSPSTLVAMSRARRPRWSCSSSWRRWSASSSTRRSWRARPTSGVRIATWWCATTRISMAMWTSLSTITTWSSTPVPLPPPARPPWSSWYRKPKRICVTSH